MEFTLRTPEGFYGRIYTYGFYDRYDVCLFARWKLIEIENHFDPTSFFPSVPRISNNYVTQNTFTVADAFSVEVAAR